jgi:putative membrane protein
MERVVTSARAVPLTRKRHRRERMNVNRVVVMLTCGAMWLGAAPVLAQTGGASTSGGPTDPQIAAIVVAANQADIDAGKLAKSKAKAKDVKQFAETMIRDHTSVNKQAKALVSKLKVKPEANPTSKSLADEGKTNVAALKKLKGADFDKSYVEHEVAYHQQVLDAIHNTLLPNAKNPELKALIEKVTPAFEAHLEHAKKLQSELTSAASK